MFLCYPLVVFLLGTAANGMATPDHTTHSTTDYVSTSGESTASTPEAPDTPSPSPTTTSSTSTPSQQGTTTALSTTLKTSDSPPSPAATPEHFTTTVKPTTESPPEGSSTTSRESTTSHTEAGSTLSVSTSVTTEMTSSHLPTESSTTPSATTLDVSDTVSESASSSTTSPVGFTSTPYSGTTLSSATPKTSLPPTTMTDHTTETTGLTHSTEPTSGITTVSTSTILTTSGNTTNTVNPTSTTMQPTDITNSTTAPPQTTILIPPFIECPARPCPLESVCLNGTCQCLSGSFLLNDRCTQAQVFPGELHLISLIFQSEMSNRSSAIFLNTAANISAALRDALKNERGYIKSEVVQLTPGSVQATVNNIFEETNATQEAVEQLIKQAIDNSQGTDGLLANATFTATNLCEQQPVPCDVLTTTCAQRSGLAFCSCKSGYVSNLYSNLSCRACPSGHSAVEDTCRPCAFGYAGFNCNDSALLAVVVISCVLGGVLLILVLSLFIYGIWRRCSKGKTEYNNSPYPVEDLSGSWPIQGITPIPRANTKWDAAPPIEMTEGGSTRNLVDKNNQTNGVTGSYDLNPDRMKTFKGKNPSRYSYLVQGHENPYFLPGDDKRD